MTQPASRTRTRLDEPLTRTGRAPAVDQIAPADTTTEPADTLAGLLGDDGDTGDDAGELTEHHYARLLELDKLKRSKKAHEEAASGLGGRIRELQGEILEWIPDLELNPDRPFDRFADEHGNSVLASVRRDIYPKFRDDPQTGKQYTRDDLFPVLTESDGAHIIVPTLDRHPWEGYVRDRVKAWRRRLKTSPRGIKATVEGVEQWVDHDGLPLRASETGYPNVDILALPRAIRAVIEPSIVPDIRFSRRAQTSSAAKAMEAKLGQDCDDPDSTGDAGAGAAADAENGDAAAG